MTKKPTKARSTSKQYHVVSGKLVNEVLRNHEKEIERLQADNARLREALGKLFQAYQDLDEDTMPENVLPLEQIQDIMPEIEAALRETEADTIKEWLEEYDDT